MEDRYYINNQPHEILLQIFHHLTPHELGQAALVCSLWQQLSSENAIWKKLTPTLFFHKQANSISFKLLFQIRKELSNLKFSYTYHTEYLCGKENLDLKRIKLLEEAIERIFRGEKFDLNVEIDGYTSEECDNPLPLTTYLKIAISYGTPTIVDYLLKNGAVLLPDVLSHTHFYNINPYFSRILTSLEEKGFDVRKNGHSILCLAEKMGLRDLANGLKKHGVTSGKSERGMSWGYYTQVVCSTIRDVVVRRSMFR